MLLLPDPAGGSPDLAGPHHASSRPLSHWTAPAWCTCAAPASTVNGEDRCFETVLCAHMQTIQACSVGKGLHSLDQWHPYMHAET